MTIPKRSAPRPEHDVPRARRPEPQREAPQRAAGHAFRTAAAQSSSPDETRADIEDAVSTAYKVWRDYVECGRRAAEQYTPFRDWSAAMNSELPPEQGPLGPWLQYWQQVARLWMGAALPFAPNGFPNQPFGPLAAAPVVTSGLTLELDAEQPAALSVRLSRPLPNAKLRAVLFNSKDELLHLEVSASKLCLKLPAGTAPGSYAGAVLDEAGNSYGAITLQVSVAGARRT